MFEMLVLLINEINPHSFFFVTCFLFIFTREALPHRGLLCTIFCIAHLRICRKNLLQEFAVAICRENLPWLFAMGFLYSKLILFCICEQILFIWKQTFFICEQNFLICEIFFINSVCFFYCRGSYGAPYFSIVYWVILRDYAFSFVDI